jgi:hypothetical protein
MCVSRLELHRQVPARQAALYKQYIATGKQERADGDGGTLMLVFDHKSAISTPHNCQDTRQEVAEYHNKDSVAVNPVTGQVFTMLTGHVRSSTLVDCQYHRHSAD